MAPSKNRHGLNSARLKHLKSVVEGDIRRGRYHGAVILIARHGAVGMYSSQTWQKPVSDQRIR